jgi:hypothetical protein
MSANATMRRRGPLDIAADMPALAEAACAALPGHWFFSDEVHNPEGLSHYRETKPVKKARLKDLQAALDTCTDCPALQLCRDYTDTHPAQTEYGVWAGTTARERRAQRRRRRAA